jgi:hypothetical protein
VDEAATLQDGVLTENATTVGFEDTSQQTVLMTMKTMERNSPVLDTAMGAVVAVVAAEGEAMQDVGVASVALMVVDVMMETGSAQEDAMTDGDADVECMADEAVEVVAGTEDAEDAVAHGIDGRTGTGAEMTTMMMSASG